MRIREGEGVETQEKFLMEEKDSREGNPNRANLELGDPGGWHSRGYLPHFRVRR